jgi:hypothetical protein
MAPMGMSGVIALVEVEPAASWIRRAKTFSGFLDVIERGEEAVGLTYLFHDDRPPVRRIETALARWWRGDDVLGIDALDAAFAEGEAAWLNALVTTGLVAVDETAGLEMPQAPRYFDVLADDDARTRRLPLVVAELGVNPVGSKRPGDRDVFALDCAWTLELMLMSRMAIRELDTAKGRTLAAELEADGIAVLTKLARQRIDGRRILIQAAS